MLGVREREREREGGRGGGGRERENYQDDVNIDALKLVMRLTRSLLLMQCRRAPKI